MRRQFRTACALLVADPADTVLTALGVALVGFALAAMWVAFP